MSESTTAAEYGRKPRRADVRPQLRPGRLLLGWLVGAVAVYVAAAMLPRFNVGDFWVALLAAALIGLLTALLPPFIAAIRLPYTVATTFLLVLLIDAGILRLLDRLTDNALTVDGWFAALIAALVIAALITLFDVVLGSNDDDAYSLRVVLRIAKKSPD